MYISNAFQYRYPEFVEAYRIYILQLFSELSRTYRNYQTKYHYCFVTSQNYTNSK